MQHFQTDRSLKRQQSVCFEHRLNQHSIRMCLRWWRRVRCSLLNMADVDTHVQANTSIVYMYAAVSSDICPGPGSLRLSMVSAAEAKPGATTSGSSAVSPPSLPPWSFRPKHPSIGSTCCIRMLLRRHLNLVQLEYKSYRLPDGTFQDMTYQLQRVHLQQQRLHRLKVWTPIQLLPNTPIRLRHP